MWFARTASLPIGLDCGTRGARLVQLRVDGDEPVVIASTRALWPDDIRAQITAERRVRPALIAPTLSRLMSQGQFIGREIAISLPRELVKIKNLRLPAMPMDDLLQAAQMEATAMFNVTEDEARVEVMPAGDVRHGTEVKSEVIAICARNDDINRLVEDWHCAGFRLASIDFEPAALYRSVERFIRRRDDEAEVNVLVDVSARRTTVLIGRGRELSFHKSIEIGGAMLTHAVSRKLGINMADAETLRIRLADTFDQVRTVGSDPVRQAVVDSVRPIIEELARELALCLRYFSVNFRGQRPSRVRLVGGESSDPSLAQMLGNALPVPIETARPIANADMSRMRAADRNERMGEWTHAFGLALKFTKGNFADRSGTARGVQAVEVEAAGADRNAETPVHGVIEISTAELDTSAAAFHVERPAPSPAPAAGGPHA
jgi:type IV pilus assembly protein PilM